MSALTKRRSHGNLPNRLAWATTFILAVIGGCTEVVELDPNDPSFHHTTPSESILPTDLKGLLPPILEIPSFPVQTRDGRIEGRTVSPGNQNHADLYRRIITREFALYPPAFRQRIGLKQVALCEGLIFEGVACNAYADVERGCLYVGIAADVEPSYIKRTFHHEVFHQIDFADDGVLDKDPQWEALNPPGFRYTQDAERVQADPDATLLDETRNGFLNLYSTTSPAEDKSEIYSNLIVDRDLILRRASRDPIIRQKVTRVRQMLDRFGSDGRLIGGSSE